MSEKCEELDAAGRVGKKQAGEPRMARNKAVRGYQ
jgi:hypothetical protein